MFTSSKRVMLASLKTILEKFKGSKLIHLLLVPERYDDINYNFHIKNVNEQIQEFVTPYQNVIVYNPKHVVDSWDYYDNFFIGRQGKIKICAEIAKKIRGKEKNTTNKIKTSFSPKLPGNKNWDTKTKSVKQPVRFEDSKEPKFKYDAPKHSTNNLVNRNITRRSDYLKRNEKNKRNTYVYHTYQTTSRAPSIAFHENVYSTDETPNKTEITPGSTHELVINELGLDTYKAIWENVELACSIEYAIDKYYEEKTKVSQNGNKRTIDNFPHVNSPQLYQPSINIPNSPNIQQPSCDSPRPYLPNNGRCDNTNTIPDDQTHASISQSTTSKTSKSNPNFIPMSVYYQNTRGLRTKLHKMTTGLPAHESDIYFLAETWLNDSVNSAELGFLHHSVYRTDRSPDNSIYKEGGGVLIAVKKNIPSYQVSVHFRATGKHLMLSLFTNLEKSVKLPNIAQFAKSQLFLNFSNY
ncbi:hypothetical protein WDU94_014028 [Cyamophila willieti]